MKIQIVVEKERVWLRLRRGRRLVAEKELLGGQIAETLLGELDKLLKENKIEKNQLDGIEALPVDGEGSSARLARIISNAGSYCLTK